MDPGARTVEQLEEELAIHQRFGVLMQELLHQFVAAPARSIDDAMGDALESIRVELGADACALLRCETADHWRILLSVVHPDIPEGGKFIGQEIPEFFPTIRAGLADGRPIFVADTGALPDERERRATTERGIRSYAIIPFSVEAELEGALFVGSRDRAVVCEQPTLGRVRAAVEVVAAAVARARAAREQDAIEAELQAKRNELVHVARLTTAGELTAALVHQISQPLAATRTNAQAARRFLDAEPANVDEVRDALDAAIESAESGAAALVHLRAMLGRRAVNLEAVELPYVARTVLAMMGQHVQSRGAIVEIEPMNELPAVRADRVQLEQVIANLVLNALDALTAAGTADPHVWIAARVIDDAIEVSVRDNGPGVGPDERPRVFDAFHTTKADGLGMGLAICRSIVAAHEGRLWLVPATDGGGAEFRFTLPLGGDAP